MIKNLDKIMYANKEEGLEVKSKITYVPPVCLVIKSEELKILTKYTENVTLPVYFLLIIPSVSEASFILDSGHIDSLQLGYQSPVKQLTRSLRSVVLRR
jgi:hypothetical protein